MQTGRQRSLGFLIGRDRVLHIRNPRIGIAHREVRDVPGRGNVLVQECGRDAQGGRDVVEAVDLDVLRQHVLGIHVHTHQSFHRSGVLSPVEALDGHIARFRTLGVGVERALHPGRERIDVLLVRLGRARRRHQVAAELA